MKKIVSLLLLFILIVSISASAMISSNATSTKENLDYSRFEIEYLMNTLEHDGTTINGSVDVYNQVMTEDLFHRGIRNYFAEHNFVRGFTAASAQVFNSELNLIDHPEHFYTVVLLDILQSNELDVFNSDSIKSSLVSNTQKVYEKVITQLADDFTGNSIKVSELTKEQIEKVASSISSTNGSSFGVYGSVADVCEYISIFVDYGTSLYTVIERINQLYAVAGANSKTIEVLNNIYSNTSNSDLKKAINYIKTAYEDLNSPAELKSEMSKTGVSIVSYTVDRLLSVTAKVVVSKVSTVMKILLTGWEIGVSLTNAWIDAGDLTTGYLLVDAAAIIENALRSCMSSYRSSYNSSKTANNAEKCREAYRLTLSTQYYATNMMQKLGYSLASFGSTIGALKSFFGCDDYQTIVEICDSTRNIIRNRYYKWVGLAERMYEIVYDVNLGHALSVPSTPVSSVSFKRGSVTMFENEYVCNIAIAYPTNAVGREITYSSSNTSVAKVGNDGKITAVSYGTATITATSQNGTKAACKVNVLPYKVTMEDYSYTINKFTGEEIAADIPDSVRGIPVTQIADDAFKNTSVTSVTLPGCVTTICDEMFYGCMWLESITIPDSVTSIGTHVFYDCKNLRSITIPDSVTSIGRGAFKGTRNLQEITLPFVGGSATSIGEEDVFGYIFDYTTSQKSGTVQQYYDESSSSYYYIPSSLKKVTITRDEIIPHGAFYNCSFLTEINIAETVTSIYASAFFGCTGLTGITLPNSVTSIGARAFNGCTGLTSVTIGDSVTSIGDDAFYGCTGLTGIALPNSVTSIGARAFNGCTGLTSVTIGDSVTSIGYAAFGDCTALREIMIPDSVTSIENDTFYRCTGLTSVTIGESVTSIGSYAFMGCSGLESIVIPEGVTSIGSGAFKGMNSLKDITLPFIGGSLASTGKEAVFGYVFGYTDFNETGTTRQYYEKSSSSYYYIPTTLRKVTITNDETIPYGAFYNCSCITEINIAETVTSIGDDAFYGCTGLTSVTIPDSVTSIGDYTFYECTRLTSVTIPDSVTSIGYAAFGDCTALREIMIPDSVTSIGNDAFYRCTGLTSVTIGDSVTSIGSCAFYLCRSLTRVTIGDGVTSIGDSAFRNCTGLTSVTIPDSVTNIGSDAFNNCTGLTSVTIGNGVTSISSYAFRNCTSLTSVTIPNNVTSIGSNAFYECNDIVFYVTKGTIAETYARNNAIPYYYQYDGTEEKIISVDLNSGFSFVINKETFTMTINCIGDMDSFKSQEAPWVKYSHYYKYVIISDGCTSISERAFRAIKEIKSVTIPDTVTSIGARAFNGCTGLTSVTIGDGVTSIGDYSFYGCTGLTSVTIGNGVTSISSYAFDDCAGLENVYYTGDISGWCDITFSNSYSNPMNYADNLYINGELAKDIIIPESVTSIGDYAFYGCAGLTSVTIGNGVTSIGKWAFYGCTGLTSVTIGNGVTSISSYAFRNCTGLTNVTIGNSVTIIGDDAFNGCTGLTSVTIPDSVTSIGDDVFYGCTGLTSVTIGDGVTSIGDYSFYGCTGLTSVSIDSGVTNIGSSAFEDCTGLTSITIPDSVISIGSSAFEYCTGLTSVTIPDSVTSIGGSAFYGCTGLTSVTIPDSVTNIGSDAFYNCTGLTSVTIGNGVTSISSYAFRYCTSLTSVTIPNNVTSIGNYVFDGCRNLEKLKVYNRDCTFGSKSTNSNTIICGYSGSTAEAYANKQGYDFELIPDNDHEHIYSNVCDNDCSICGYIDSSRGHNYVNVCDPYCDVCGYIGKPIHTDKNTDSICDLCGKYLSDITVGYTENIEVSSGKTVYLKFVPEITGVYTFYSSGSSNTYGYVCDSNMCTLEYDDDDGNGRNFLITYTFIADTVYYLGVKYYSSSTSGTIPVLLRIDESLCNHKNTYPEHKDATCTENGYDKVICFDCSKTVNSTVIPATGHTMGEWTIEKASTCTMEGSKCTNCTVCNKKFTEKLPVLAHTAGEWVVTVSPTATQSGVKTRTCSGCGIAETVELPCLVFETAEQVTISSDTGIMSGFNSGLSSLDSYVTVGSAVYTWSYETNNGRLGTGSKAIIKDGDTVVAEYTILIFGDTTGDSWYDGMDAVLVACLANGMLTKDDVGEAVYMAADCNHDGVIDQLDVDLLNHAGTLLANVDQSKPTEVLLETSAEYVEYLDLIDQSPEIEIEDETDVEPNSPELGDTEEEGTHEEDTEDSTRQDARVDILEMILNFIKSIFEMLLSYISVPIK